MTPAGSTVIVPDRVVLEQLPEVVTVKLLAVAVVILSIGVPDIVTTPEFTLKFTPLGNPLTDAPLAPPSNIYVIFSIASPSQTVCNSLLLEVSEISSSGLTTIDIAMGSVVHPLPWVVTLKLYVIWELIAAVGVPLRVNVPAPALGKIVNPSGRFSPTTIVAPALGVKTISVIASPSHNVCVTFPPV